MSTYSSNSMIKFLKDFFSKGHQRSLEAKKHIFISLFVKGSNILITFLLVPLTISYITESQYGIWLTLSAMVYWFEFFDFGLGHGLRNRLAEALANDNTNLARAYISSAYAIISIISMGMLVFFLLLNPLLDWTKILNTSAEMRLELSTLTTIVFSFFCLSFIMKLLFMIFKADQKPSYVGAFNLVINVIKLATIFILTLSTKGTLLYLGIVLSVAPLVVLLATNFYYFNTHYKSIAPSFKYIRKQYFQDLMNLGVQFFLIQIAVFVMFSTDNIIITQLYSPAEVVPYNIAYRYIGIVLQVFAIISLPFWSAYTEAFAKKDMDWIKNTMNKLRKIWVLFAIGGLFLVLISKQFYALWVPSVEVPYLLSFCMWLYALIHSYGNIYVSFINGVSKIRLQLWVSIIAGIANIPLSIFFCKTVGMGTAGVIFATFTCLIFYYGIMIIQCKRLLAGTARGIWNL